MLEYSAVAKRFGKTTALAGVSFTCPAGAVMAGAATGLALRIVTFGGHLLVVRARAAFGLRALAVVWGGAMLVAAAVGLPGGDALALRPVLEPLLEGVLEPSRLSAAWLLAALAVLVAAALGVVAAARGVEERAHIAARRLAEVQETLRQWHSGHEPGLTTESRTGVQSLPGWGALSGERAFAFRTLSHQRRMILPSILVSVFLLDVGLPIVLLVAAPSFVWAWTALGVLGAFASGGAQLAIERDHHHLRMAPVRPLRALLWLAAVPAAHRLISVELSWLPVLLAPGVTPGVWAGGAVLSPCLIALAEGAGAVAVVLARRKLVRAALRVGVALGGVLPATVVLSASLALGSPAFLAAVAAAAGVLAAASACFAFATHRTWPRSTRARDHR